MTPSYAAKAGVRYRYYISRREAGSAGNDAAPIVRVSAPDVEDAVLRALTSAVDANAVSRRMGTDESQLIAVDPSASRTSAMRQFVERVDIAPAAIEIRLIVNPAGHDRSDTIVVPWAKRPTRVKRDVIAPAEGQWSDPRAMSSEMRSRLLSAIAASRCWFDELVAGRAADVEALATREGRSPRSVTMLLSLAFLAPDIVKAIVDNRMPRGVGVTQLVDLSCEWSHQRRALGLATA
jgi:hypothetical protein